MLDLVFLFITAMVFSRLAIFAFRATWGLARIIVSIVLLPLFICFAFFKGLLYVAWPILAVVALYAILIKK